MHRKYPSDLPTSPLRRFYIKDNSILEVEGEAWVEAESAVVAAHMARTLYGILFTGFSHEECLDSKTGEPSRYAYMLDGALGSLGKVLRSRAVQGTKRSGNECLSFPAA